MISFCKSIISLLRLQNPIGAFLLFFPCAFGILFSSNHEINLSLIKLFFIGSIIMRSAGCIINDLFDQNLDKLVERTKNRPLASGALANLDAIIILAILLFIGLLIISLLSTKSILLGFSSMIFVISYPLFKRFTYFPQLCLGIVFNIGILVSYINTMPLNHGIIIAYIGCIFWTLGYDTIYAFADIKDDKKIGIKSTAIFFQNISPKLWITSFYVIFICCMMICSHILSQLSIIMMITYISAFLMLLYQATQVDIQGNLSNIRLFKLNYFVGFIIIIGMFLSKIS